jgi:GntR family transcriptional repressor for pyruvate dehydrogenase complex
MNGIKKVKSESLRAQVYAQLKEQLMRGTWKEGEKLPYEHELCTMFGVSRITVRAAIQQLSILGLVETRQGGGTFVKSYSMADQIDAVHPMIGPQKHQDLLTILEYRKIVEKGTLGLAKEKITPEDLESLENLYEKMKQATDDFVEFSKADIAFHYEIGKISRNPIIIKVYALIYEMLSVAMEDIVRTLGTRDGLKYHREIIDALKNGCKTDCEAIMDEHIAVTIKRVRENN